MLVFYRGVLFSRAYGIPYDLDGYHYPLVAFIASTLRQGKLPLWDPYIYCGVPFYANVQAQLFYPPAWPFFLLAAINQHNTFRLLECMVVAHVFLAGAFTYWLLRRIGLGRGAALFGGTVFQLGGFFASQTQHAGAVCGTAWLPAAWLGVLLLAERWTWKRLGMLSVALAMSILAGFPATMAAVAGSAILLAVSLVAMRRARTRLLASVACAIMLGFLLAAVEVLPALELKQLSQAGMRGEWTVSGGGLPLQSLVSLVAPDHYHILHGRELYAKQHLPWEPLLLYLYCGLAAPVLALLAVAGSKHKYRWVFAALTVLSALWMLCDNTPVGRHLFPLLPKVLKGGFYPEFAMAPFLLGFTVLAALGAEQFLAPRGRIVTAALIALTAFDLIHTGAGTWMNTNQAGGVSYLRINGSWKTLDRMRALANETFPPSRSDEVAESHLWAGAASMLQVPSANGDDPVALWRLLQVRFCFAQGPYWMRYYEVAAPGSPVLNLLNIRFLLTRAAALPSGGDFFLRENLEDGTHIYENRSVLPRFFLVGRVEQARGLQDALHIMHSADFDPAHTAVVEARVPPRLDAQAGGSVRTISYTDRELSLEVEATGDGFLVTSEAYYPGWRAWIDGREADLVLTNAAFRGLPVPAGRHHVRMRFEPRILWYGAAMSLMTIAFVAGAGFCSRRINK